MNTDSTLTGSRPLLKKFFVNASAVIIMDLSVEAASAQEAKEIAKQAYDRWCDDVNGAADTRSDAGPINKPLNGVTSFYSEVVHLDVESPGERTWEY